MGGSQPTPSSTFLLVLLPLLLFKVLQTSGGLNHEMELWQRYYSKRRALISVQVVQSKIAEIFANPSKQKKSLHLRAISRKHEQS